MLQNYKLKDLIGEIILTAYETEVNIEDTEEGFRASWIGNKSGLPMEINFPEVYPSGDKKGKEIEIFCDIV